MRRYQHIIPHLVIRKGMKVGRLLSISFKRVTPNETVSVNANIKIATAIMRREPVFNGMVGVHSYFVPDRHVYGEDSQNFIRQGYDENITFTGVTLNGPAHYLDIRQAGTVPKDLVYGYNQIWNRFYRDIRNPDDLIQENYYPTAEDARLYGHKTTHIPNLLSKGLLYTADLEATERQAPLKSSNTKIDLLDLEKVRARYESEIDLNWFDNRYSPVLKRIYGSPGVNIDADERPEELIDINKKFGLKPVNSDGVTISQGMEGINLKIPPKNFAESGMVWIVAVLRFPSVYYDEIDFLSKTVNPSFEERAGHGDIIRTMEPVNITAKLYKEGSEDTTNLGLHPWGEWYRHKATFVNPDLKNNPGYPILPFPESAEEAKYIPSHMYDECFIQAKYGHAVIDAEVTYESWSTVPSGLTSIYAGTNI